MEQILATYLTGTRSRRAAASLAALALALASAGPAAADVKAGVDAWTAGDYTRAVVEWQEPAAAGDADAIFNLAQAYRLGRGVELDNARARKLYEEASRLGHVKAADNFGLMLFQEGEQARAMPMIKAASDRGDPRAQYVLALSHFNADYAPRDWVRAYALMTLANGAGLPQARDALGQMDRFIPQAQRSQAQVLARDIEAGATAQRNAELGAAELATRAPAGAAQMPQLAPVTRTTAPVPVTIAAAKPAMARPAPAAMPVARPVSAPVAAPVSGPVSGPASAPVVVGQGRWRVQLGAFGVAANADRLWSQLSGNAALAGTRKALVPSGKLTRLLATGFASQADANRACDALKRQGQACIVAGQN